MAILKPQINGKYLRKKQKGDSLLNTYIKRILKPKYSLSGAWFLHLAGQWSQIAPLPSRQLLHHNKHFKSVVLNRGASRNF